MSQTKERYILFRVKDGRITSFSDESENSDPALRFKSYQRCETIVSYIREDEERV